MVRPLCPQIALLFDEVVTSLEDGRWLFEQFYAEVENYDNNAQAKLLRLCIHFAEAQVDQEVLQYFLFDLASDEAEDDWGFNSMLKMLVSSREWRKPGLLPHPQSQRRRRSMGSCC